MQISHFREFFSRLLHSWLVIWIQIQLYLLTLFRLTKMCPWHSEVGCSLRKEVILGLSTTSSSNCSFSTTFSSICSFEKKKLYQDYQINYKEVIRKIYLAFVMLANFQDHIWIKSIGTHNQWIFGNFSQFPLSWQLPLQVIASFQWKKSWFGWASELGDLSIENCPF